MKDLSLHLMDIAQNSISAGANKIIISLKTRSNPAILEFDITDNGKGMKPDLLEKVTDPFTTTRVTRDVGLGIPLLKLSAEMAEGKLQIKSAEEKGTSINATFRVNSIDRIPIGDVAGTLVMLIMANPKMEWEFLLSSHQDEFRLNTQEIEKVLNGVSIQEAEVLKWIQNTCNEGIKSVFGGVLDEVS